MKRDFREQYGPWALVAGASVGLGAAFARQLAARGLNLVLLARRADALGELAAALTRDHGVQVRTAALDLGGADLLSRVREATEGVPIGLLVYNAAASVIGPFLDQDLAGQLGMLDVNCRAPLILCHELGRMMAARGRGGILLMSSMAGSQGAPLIATYGATKAWNLVFAEGLWDELKGQGVDVLACRAGATRTPAYEQSQPQAVAPMMEPESVATQALAALGSGPSMVPGWVNRGAAFFMGRLVPRGLAVKIMGAATRKMYPGK